MKKKIRNKKENVKKISKTSSSIAILSLILNILILPGLGTLVAKQYKAGIWQIVIALISLPLMLVIVGFFTFGAVWIWSLITSIRILQEAS